MQDRTDTHRPSTFDPAEYTEVGYFDAHPEEGGEWLDEEYRMKNTFAGNYEHRSRCDHCGAGPLRYGVIFHHHPSDLLVVVGTTCAGRLGLATRSDFERKQALEQAVRERKVRDWQAAAPVNAEVKAFLDDLEYEEDGQRRIRFGINGGTFSFLSDLRHKLNRYGSLSEKQVEAVVKIKARAEERQAERDAEPKPTTPLAEGRYVVEGKVLTTKLQESMYGETLKMLVLLDDLNKVWGTVPTSIEEKTWSSVDGDGNVTEGVDLKGARIRFTAAVERSRDDEHFGFYKRPTKAEIISEASAT